FINPHAIFVGLLFAAIMPVGMPWWAIPIGLFMGLLFGQYVYGGWGSNPFNPVLVGWAVLKLSYPGYMDISGSVLGALKLEGIGALVEDYSYFSEGYGIEGISGFGAKLKLLFKILFEWKTGPWADQLISYVGGICALAIIIGGLYLLWKRYISWHAPIGFILTVFVFSVLFYKGDKAYLYPYLLIQLFTGTTLLTAFFLVTDPITTPFTGIGMFIFGILVGVVTMVGRLWGSWIEPAFFGVLVANSLTPLIDRVIKPKPFGRVKSSA
ncbi:MAG: RnfABCDGE type electron transport complex subunit D, partial [Candidatus Desulfofervidaceae bacterium]|nr:RnfABCDGE type electron transport complex subunit D [Candidatus Desulfofervidaceae bacterium]